MCLKIGINLHIFLIYFARSKILSLRDHVIFLELGHVHVYVRDECPFEWCLTLASLSFPFVLFFFARVRLLLTLFSGGWRAFGEPLLTDFIDERAQWMTKVLDDHDISRKAMMFDQAQNVKR